MLSKLVVSNCILMKLRFSFVFMFFPLLLSKLVAVDTAVLNGMVVDKNATPLIGATVNVNSIDKTVVTNQKGFFRCTLPKGRYIISVSSIGFVIYKDSVDVVEDKTFHIVMREDINSLGEIIVRENYENYKNKSEALSVEVVKSDFLLENNASNFVKTLEKLPGVYSMDIGAGFSKPIIRGMGFNRVLVSENGIKQEGQQWGADHGLELDQYNIQKVEVYKGPMSLQYGSDAIGGIIKVISSSAPVRNGFFAEALMIGKSVNDLWGMSVMTGWKHNAWFGRLRLTEQHYADYRVPTDTVVYLTRKLPIYNGRLKNTAGTERNFSAVMGYNLSNFQSTTSLTNVYQINGFFPGSHGMPDVKRVQDDGDNRNIDLPHSSVNHLKIINNSKINIGQWKLVVDLGYQHNMREERSLFHTHYGTQQAPKVNPDLELQFDLTSYTGNFRLESDGDKKWKHIVGIGSDVQNNRIAGYGFLMPNYFKWGVGAYGIEKYKVNDQWEHYFRRETRPWSYQSGGLL
jgi:iron complex outermembrane receptor protein